MGVTNHPLWLRSELAREQCRLAGDLSIREQARSYYRRFKAGVGFSGWPSSETHHLGSDMQVRLVKSLHLNQLHLSLPVSRRSP